MFRLDLVSVFFHLAALCTFVYACVVRPFGALLRIFNIVVRHTIVSPCSVAVPYPLLFFFFSSPCTSRCLEPIEEYMEEGYMGVVRVCAHAL